MLVTGKTGAGLSGVIPCTYNGKTIGTGIIDNSSNISFYITDKNFMDILKGSFNMGLKDFSEGLKGIDWDKAVQEGSIKKVATSLNENKTGAGTKADPQKTSLSENFEKKTKLFD